ncbi:uncharacterized protein LOC107266503 isoform X3 [Cephus cinctus]|uniref:Uncharacterized protein LOC107266503 isoform X3 n=1 Tax=Cephus cinctus TaxID=211228 RepID=A0AAJ7BRI5_CEPCN|nr:uncharacterized protein LOC107266503 isoform X3 [Cephus cinctus]
MIFTSGTSVAAVSVISGICFYLIHSLRKGKSTESNEKPDKKIVLDDSRCACCLKPFFIGRGVVCGDCGSRSCRKGCTRWDSSDNAWRCLFCHQRRLLQSWLRRNEKWFELFGGVPIAELEHKFSTAKSKVHVAGAEHAGVSPALGLAAGSQEDEDTVETVRDFVEKIVEGLVGNVDETAIDRLYDHPAYDQLLEKYSAHLAAALARLAVALQLSITNKPATDTPTMAHTALRELVERAVEEARKLPGLGGSETGRSQEGRDISDQSYEDLLATAILNKVIEKYQREHIDGNSNVLREKSSPRPKFITSEIEVGLDEGVEEGSSSLEPLSQDEYSSDTSVPPSRHIRTRQEPLSLTIEEHIEEVTTTYTSDEDREENETNELDFKNARRVPFPEFGMDIIDPSQESSEDSQEESDLPSHVDHVIPVESWEENWLFQKKKMQAQSEPVAMLVPNPSADFRALIGDKDAEDTSDLSECSAQSDEEIEEELMQAINNVVPKSLNDSEVRQTFIEDQTLTGGTLRDTDKRESIVEEFLEKEQIIVKPSSSPVQISKVTEVLSQNVKKHVNVENDLEKVVYDVHDAQEGVEDTGKVEVSVEVHNVHIDSGNAERKLRKEEIDDVKNKETDKSNKIIEESSKRMDILRDLSKPDDHIHSNDKDRPTNIEPIIENSKHQLETMQKEENDDTQKISEYTIKATNDSSVNGQEETLNLKLEKERASTNLFVETKDANSQNTSNSVKIKDSQLIHEAKFELSVNHENRTETSTSVTREYNLIDRQLISLIDENPISETPKTPTSSPARNSIPGSDTEHFIKHDLRSLDKKLESIETSMDRQLDSFEVVSSNENDDLISLESATNTFVKINSEAEDQSKIEKGNDRYQSQSINVNHNIDNQGEDGAQQESEYTEHYDIATQRHFDTSTKNDVPQRNNDVDEIPPPIPKSPPPPAETLRQCREALAVASANITLVPSSPGRKRVEADIQLATPPRPGTIAEREHKKWENAAPIENNPYSEENIQKRLWERQYSRRSSSDVLGNTNELPKGPGEPLQVILGATQPDYKRFGRDYYINDAKVSSDERPRRSAMSSSGRPNSSLSQHSSMTGSELEHQDQTQYTELGSTSSGTNEVKSKVSTWQQNNMEISQPEGSSGIQRVEAVIQIGSPSSLTSESQSEEVQYYRSNVTTSQRTREHQVNEILENERKNSKNELNAKLNNQDGYDGASITESKKLYSNEGHKKIQRIDLKAYGFENEISSRSNEVKNTSQKRVVNKLDLKSFGYDTGVHTTRYTSQADSNKVNNNSNTKPMIVKMKTKSNLTKLKELETSTSTSDYTEYWASGDRSMVKSTETLNENELKLEDRNKFGTMISVKSMPNVAKSEHYAKDSERVRSYEGEEDIIIKTFIKKRSTEEKLRKEMIKASSKSHGLWKSETILAADNSELSDVYSEDEVDGSITKTKSTEVFSSGDHHQKSSEVSSTKSEFSEEATSSINADDEDLPMPSVRRLAQAFSKTTETKPVPAARMSKSTSNIAKERSTTPEILIVETPRQMHSLTARSLSKEFREGLRQIPIKMTQSPTNHTVDDQSKKVENQPEIVLSEADNPVDDTALIEPGKLKNNIKFWEQLQRRS